MNFSGHKYSGKELEKAKIVFQFLLMLIAATIGGICFANLLGEDVISRLTDNMCIHFSSTLPKGEALSSFMAAWMRGALADILCIVILFVFSFSFINYLVSDFVLVFIGFRFGINSALIGISAMPLIGLGNSLSFWLLRGAILPLILVYSCKMAIHTIDFKMFSVVRGRTVLNRKSFFSMLILTVGTIGTVLMFNGLYCVFIYIF